MTPTPSPSKAASVSQGVPDGKSRTRRDFSAEGTGYTESRLDFTESEIEANFDVAMSIVLNGGSIRRRDWNRPAYVEKESRVDGMTLPIIVMVMRDGTVGPYTPSQCDMVASDWVQVVVAPWKPGPENIAHKRGGETW